MPRTCTICSHDRRSDIEAAMVSGDGFRNIAERFAVSAAAVFRHKQHVAATLAKAKEVADVAHGDDLLAKLNALERDARCILDEARGLGGGDKNPDRALRAIDRLARLLELLAKLKGELAEGVTVNVATVVTAEAVASMPLPEKELRVRNALAALARLKAKTVVSVGAPSEAPS